MICIGINRTIHRELSERIYTLDIFLSYQEYVPFTIYKLVLHVNYQRGILRIIVSSPPFHSAPQAPLQVPRQPRPATACPLPILHPEPCLGAIFLEECQAGQGAGVMRHAVRVEFFVHSAGEVDAVHAMLQALGHRADAEVAIRPVVSCPAARAGCPVFLLLRVHCLGPGSKVVLVSSAQPQAAGSAIATAVGGLGFFHGHGVESGGGVIRVAAEGFLIQGSGRRFSSFISQI